MSDFTGVRTPDTSISTSRISLLRRTNTPMRSFTTPTVMGFNTIRSESSIDSPECDYSLTFNGGNDVDSIIKAFVEVGDFQSAVCWMDSVFARDNDDGVIKPVALANYVKALSSVQEWMRVSSILDHSRLISRHVVFAYYYVNALFNRKLYSEIPTVPVGHLLDNAALPIKYPKVEGHVDLTYSTGDPIIIPEDERKILDTMAKQLKVGSAFNLVYGRTFLHLENRDAAAKCLWRALKLNPDCILAERLIHQYKLDHSDDRFKDYMVNVVETRIELDSKADPRVLTDEARTAYSRGDAKKALEITNTIMKRHGLYMDCIVVHVNALVQLGDQLALFLLGHKMVDALPDHEFSWYTVAMYYYVNKNPSAAKNFMSKATQMNPGFGDGWLAFGHIMVADAENEQALSCYYRASRILERHFEPLLYVAMQYGKSGVDLSQKFLSDAASREPYNPIVLHEQGVLFYNRKEFQKAYNSLERALRFVSDVEEKAYNSSVGVVTPPTIRELIRSSSITPFWESLVSNLGHCCRRLNRHDDAIHLYERSLLMNSQNCAVLVAIGLSNASLGRTDKAMVSYHKALSVNPHDERHVSVEELTDLFSTVSPAQERAAAAARKRNSGGRGSLMSRTCRNRDGTTSRGRAISPVHVAPAASPAYIQGEQEDADDPMNME